jgi:16S rRNA (uracil1498-N3)-methyltransferase
MQFVYDKNASQTFLTITDENYRYLFKAKRLKVGDSVSFRNLIDDNLYIYKIENISKKEANLTLKDSALTKQKLKKNLHLIWCVIDSKLIYATLPMLNQLGVSKISFVYCDRSQKNFKVDFLKCQKILINSCQQSGRVDLMELEMIDSLADVLSSHDDISVLDFGGELTWQELTCVLVGCEGGFSEDEREKLKPYKKIGLNTDLILKSETAILTIASKLLI